MVTFSWIGLADLNWYTFNELDQLPGDKVAAEQLSPNLLLAVKVLENANSLQSKRVGVGASISDSYLAFNDILIHKDAELAFEYLLRVDNLTSKIYAMFGLKSVNEARFDELKSIFESSKQLVHIQSGCLGSMQTVSDAMGFSVDAQFVVDFNLQ